MKRLRRSIGVLLIITALIVMQLPVGPAEAADSAGFLYEGSTLIAYQGSDSSVTVPSGVTVIGSSAFEDNLRLEKITFPKSLRRIKPYAFWGCNSLKEIQFGTGLKEIGDYSFTSCQGLTEVSVPSNITSIGIRAFADCVSLRTINIPETVTYIHETAFDGCKKLVIQCMEGSYADKYARDFYRRQAQMEEYEDVNTDPGSDFNLPDEEEASTVPDQETEEDTSNLLGTTSVVANQAVVLINSSVPTVYQGLIPTESDTTYPVKYRIVNDSVIADQAYYKDRTLQEIVLPEQIQEVGEFAFARSTASRLYVPEGVEQISFGAFYHADQLIEVTLASTVRKVEPESFGHTPWVERFLENGEGGQGEFLISGGVLVAYRGEEPVVEIPEGVRVIAAECFQGRKELQKIVLPESLTDIGEGAFEDCSSLQELEWKNGLFTIGDRAFAGCSLEEVTVPGTVKELGLGAFDSGTAVYFLGKEPTDTHESSAERLSNENYRFVQKDSETGRKQGGSVLVLGMTGARASLSGAMRPYTLSLNSSAEQEDLNRAKKAFSLNIGKNLPQNALIIKTDFSDDSGIPITRLGKQILSVYLPIPENLAGQELSVCQYDRNGQLEPVPVRYVNSGDQLYVLLELNHVFDLVLTGTGEGLLAERIEEMSGETVQDAAEGNYNEVLSQQTEKKGTSFAKENQPREITPLLIIKWGAGSVLLLAGLFLALSKVK